MPKPNGNLQQNPRGMDPGILGTFVEDLTSQLTSIGHTRLTVTMTLSGTLGAAAFATPEANEPTHAAHVFGKED
jgi:hypothetical protein